jgi:hypothetical protein
MGFLGGQYCMCSVPYGWQEDPKVLNAMGVSSSPGSCYHTAIIGDHCRELSKLRGWGVASSGAFVQRMQGPRPIPSAKTKQKTEESLQGPKIVEPSHFS